MRAPQLEGRGDGGRHDIGKTPRPATRRQPAPERAIVEKPDKAFARLQHGRRTGLPVSDAVVERCDVARSQRKAGGDRATRRTEADWRPHHGVLLVQDGRNFQERGGDDRRHGRITAEAHDDHG